MAHNRTPEQLPHPWLFNSEKLLNELDRCRELILQIPINDSQATHFGIKTAVDRIWNLTQTIRYLLSLHRDLQRSFAKQGEALITSRLNPRRDPPNPRCARWEKTARREKEKESIAPQAGAGHYASATNRPNMNQDQDRPSDSPLGFSRRKNSLNASVSDRTQVTESALLTKGIIFGL